MLADLSERGSRAWRLLFGFHRGCGRGFDRTALHLAQELGVVLQIDLPRSSRDLVRSRNPDLLAACDTLAGASVGVGKHFHLLPADAVDM